MRNLTFTMALVAAFTVTASNAWADLVTLKPGISVTGEQITFGDVFKGAGDKSDYVIAAAPAPGKKVIFKASSLAYVARKHGLDWRPTRPIKRVVVNRNGSQIPQQLIVDEIRFAMEMELEAEHFEITLSTRHPKIHVAKGATLSVAVESLSYSRKGGNFVATVVAPADDPDARSYKVSGKIFTQIQVPVINRAMQPGEAIRASDLDYKLVRSSKISRNTVTDANDLIGRSPRRLIRAGHPVGLNNLGDPVTITKGKLVTVTFKSGGVSLAITGRTLEAGAEGDIIRVENINSRKTIQAQVIDAEQVRIITAGQRLAKLN